MMTKKYYSIPQLLFITCFILVTTSSLKTFAQINAKGEPPSFSYQAYQKPAPIHYPKNIDLKGIINKAKQENDVFNPKIGKLIPMNLDLLKGGEWTNFPEGKLSRTEIKLTNAKALGLIFDDFYLPEGAKLFIYTPDRSQVLGAYTSINNSESEIFSVELLVGDRAIIEYYEPFNTPNTTKLHLGEVAYIYGDLPAYILNPLNTKDLSGSCNVNINCPEGEPWQIQKKGVAKILLYDSGSAFWCSGSLVNNTRFDNHPYFLTANHCGSTSSMNDYTKWVFYFKDESPTCQNAEPIDSRTLTGSRLLANSQDLSLGSSDFKLLEINNGEQIPSEYDPFYNGWDRTGNGSIGGVSIHHPSGDVKKISFYDETTSTFYDHEVNPIVPGDGKKKFWAVNWLATQSGHGITEGGSSGSPLFSKTGHIIGTLSGGYAGCTNLNGTDYYGKFAIHWDNEGSSANRQLAVWLDPDNIGTMVLQGSGGQPAANFTSFSEKFQIGTSVQYRNVSTGFDQILNYKWTFEGGEPSSYESIEKVDPPAVVYKNYGVYKVSLTVEIMDENEETYTNTLTKEVSVLPEFARREDGSYLITFGSNVPENLKIRVYTPDGAESFVSYQQEGQNTVLIKNTNNPRGVYLYRITGKDLKMTQKVVKF